jgi:hypothetical protein
MLKRLLLSQEPQAEEGGAYVAFHPVKNIPSEMVHMSLCNTGLCALKSRGTMLKNVAYETYVVLLW